MRQMKELLQKVGVSVFEGEGGYISIFPVHQEPSIAVLVTASGEGQESYVAVSVTAHQQFKFSACV